MDPKIVLVITWVLAGLVVAAYIWFVVWRFRVEKRKKEAQDVSDAAMSDAIAKTATAAAAAAAPQRTTASTASPSTPPVATPTPLVEPTQPAAMVDATVASCLSGISLPNDLVPLTTILARPAVGDRVAFWTDRAPAEIVGPAFAAELERLGYAVQSLDERTLSAQRESVRLLVMIHPDGARAVIGDQLAFSTVPERSVVIETWLPE